MKIKALKWLTLCFIMGFVYLGIEVIFRAISGEMVGTGGIKYISMAGWTTLWMILVGGLCGLLLGLFNEMKWSKDFPIVIQSLVGTMVIIIIELFSGLFFNVLLGLSLWDYSDWPLNIFGQTSIVFGVFWFFLTPMVFWLDDFLRFAVYGEDSKYNILVPYKKLFTLQ